MRTVQSLLLDARQVLHSAELSRPDWTWAEVISARLVGGPNTRRLVGDLGWREWSVRFVEVDRGVRRTLAQHGKTLETGISGVFLVRLGLHHRFGFQAELFDVMPETVGSAAEVASSFPTAAIRRFPSGT
jgi:hypothetical protein